MPGGISAREAAGPVSAERAGGFPAGRPVSPWFVIPRFPYRPNIVYRTEGKRQGRAS